MKAAVYLRQSLDRSGEGAAIARQREDCLALARKRGWEPVEFVDNDVSASSGRRRPAYESMLKAAEAGEVQAVVVWDLDRLHRRPIELEHFISLADRRQLSLATVTGDVDLSTDNGRLFARIKGAVARAEVERKGERQRRALLQAAQAGKPSGGPRPFGFEPDGMKPRPRESKLIREAYRLLLEGASLRSLARRWNGAGAITCHGNAWMPSTVRRVLLNPRYAGLRSHQGEIIGSAAWPSIVPEETWRAACALLGDEARRTSPTSARRYMLSGLARCFCGALMDTGRTQHGVRTYKCSKSRHLSRSAEPIDDFIERLVVARLKRPDLLELLDDCSREDVAEMREEAAALRIRLEEAAELYDQGVLSAAQLSQATTRTRKRLEEVHATLTVSGQMTSLSRFSGADVDKVWGALDIDERRAVIDTLLELTLLSPGRGARKFEPESVGYKWRTHQSNSRRPGSRGG